VNNKKSNSKVGCFQLLCFFFGFRAKGKKSKRTEEDKEQVESEAETQKAAKTKNGHDIKQEGEE